MSAIKIKIKKAEGEFDFGQSRFLGQPVLPEKWEKGLDENKLFLLQINLEEIKDLDKNNLLPHEGYLYFFLDIEGGAYNLKPHIRYYKGQPNIVIDDFNSQCPEFEEFTTPWLVEFEECEDTAEGTKLLGVPSPWAFGEEEEQDLLMQFDPLELNDMGLFPTFDGMIYFFFGENKGDFKKVRIVEDFS